MKRNGNKIVIHWFITSNILLEYKTTNNETLYDTNKYGTWAQVIYDVYSMPFGVSYSSVRKSGPRVDVRSVSVCGKTFSLIRDKPKEIVIEELTFLEDHFNSDKGKKYLHALDKHVPIIKITDLLS